MFAAIYLLYHGVAKLGVVVAVPRDQLWAYPTMIVMLVVFIVYQVYRLWVRVTVGLVVITIFDGFVVWLTWLEYDDRRKRRAGQVARTTPRELRSASLVAFDRRRDFPARPDHRTETT